MGFKDIKYEIPVCQHNFMKIVLIITGGEQQTI